MTLRQQITADNETVFFNAADFGEAATYIAPDGTETDITVVCQGEELKDRVTDAGVIRVRENIFEVKISEVSNPQNNGYIEYNSEAWPIVGKAGRDHACVSVVCELPSVGDRSRRNYRER